MAFAIYFYCAVTAAAWLVLWLSDICRIKYATTCEGNAAEQLSLRICSYLCVYMAAIPFLLVQTNKNHDSFLKRMAFHLQYGLMAILGCNITRHPASMDSDPEEESWYHIGDKIFAFLTFFILFAYTAKNETSSSGVSERGPTAMVQPPHHGHGVNPRTFLVLFGIAGLLPLVKKFPLDEIVPEGTEITERAKFFYSLSQCLGLACLMILFVPIHFGTDEDQRNTTIAIIVIEVVVGTIMFHGSAWNVWIRPGLHHQLLMAPIICSLVALAALINGARYEKKNSEYAVIYDSARGAAVVL